MGYNSEQRSGVLLRVSCADSEGDPSRMRGRPVSLGEYGAK